MEFHQAGETEIAVNLNRDENHYWNLVLRRDGHFWLERAESSMKIHINDDASSTSPVATTTTLTSTTATTTTAVATTTATTATREYFDFNYLYYRMPEKRSI